MNALVLAMLCITAAVLFSALVYITCMPAMRDCRHDKGGFEMNGKVFCFKCGNSVK